MLTRKDLNRYVGFAEMTGREIKRGYCCHYDRADDVKDEPLIELGYNAGIYGWNWTLYMDSKTLYIDGYRNF